MATHVLPPALRPPVPSVEAGGRAMVEKYYFTLYLVVGADGIEPPTFAL
jgi:hypothetical protein